MTEAPVWAAKIWCTHYTIFCELPGPNDTSHTIQVTNDVVGMKNVLVMIQARDALSRVGSKGDPTKLQIARPSFAKKRPVKPKTQFTTEQRNSARQLLRQLGLI